MSENKRNWQNDEYETSVDCQFHNFITYCPMIITKVWMHMKVAINCAVYVCGKLHTDIQNFKHMAGNLSLEQLPFFLVWWIKF